MTAARTFRLHVAEPADGERLFRWRNLPDIVALGTTQRTVTREEHFAWFERVRNSPDYLLLIVFYGADAIGQVRFERLAGRASCASVSIYLLAPYTGRGLGVRALVQGCSVAFDQLLIDSIVAFVRQTNRNSLVAFQKAGFRVDRTFAAPVPSDHVALTLHRTATER